MVSPDLPIIGSLIKLTGDQVYTVRRSLNESQPEFARRFALSQAAISRIEARRDVEQSGPLIILVHLLARQYRINLQKTIEVRTARGRGPVSTD